MTDPLDKFRRNNLDVVDSRSQYDIEVDSKLSDLDRDMLVLLNKFYADALKSNSPKAEEFRQKIEEYKKACVPPKL